jgi:hypothetical protein
VTTGEKKIRLRVTVESDADFVEVTATDGTLLRKSEFSNYNSGPIAYSADLNKDSIPDFVICLFSHGCGLASGHCNVAFVLSSGREYRLTTVSTLFPDASDFVMINSTPCFIHTSFLGVEKCNDGKRHNFWVYNLLSFRKDGIKINNTVHLEFPKVVWYTSKPNHSETTIITDEQKAHLRKSSLTEIFWKRKDHGNT